MTRISNWISIYTKAASFPSVISVPFSISQMFSEPKNTLRKFSQCMFKKPMILFTKIAFPRNTCYQFDFFSFLTETEAPSHTVCSLNDRQWEAQFVPSTLLFSGNMVSKNQHPCSHGADVLEEEKNNQQDK